MCLMVTGQITELSVACNQPYGQKKSQAKSTRLDAFKIRTKSRLKTLSDKIIKLKKKSTCLYWWRLQLPKFQIFQELLPKYLQKIALIVVSRGILSLPKISHLCFAATQISVPPMATGQIPYNPILFSSCFPRTDALSPHQIPLSETICIPCARVSYFS